MSAEEHAQMTGGSGPDHPKDKRHGKHANGKHSGKHATDNDANENADLERPIAIGPESIPGDIPTGTTVVVALGLAVGLGMLGGWVLRVSNPS